jgi:hypothetical protein
MDKVTEMKDYRENRNFGHLDEWIPRNLLICTLRRPYYGKAINPRQAKMDAHRA